MPSLSLLRPGMLRECWQFRDFIFASVKREFVSRYLGTQLGFFWTVAQPLALVLIYTVVFAQIMRPVLPGYTSPFAYSIYLCSGILVWQLFSDLLNRSVGVFVHNGNLLKKANLPKLALPVIVTLSALTNFIVITVLFVAFLVATGEFPGTVILALVPVVIVIVALAVGMGVLLGTINVFYRDVEQSTSMLLQFWFWLTPIVYPGRSMPSAFATVLQWNPLWPIVDFTHAVFLDRAALPWSTLAYPALLAVVFLTFGLYAFRKLSGEIVDEL